MLMGPTCCNLLLSNLNISKIPGLLRWSKSPDAIILQYLKFARQAKANLDSSSPNLDFALPDNSVTVDQLYAEAHIEDLELLYQVCPIFTLELQILC